MEEEKSFTQRLYEKGEQYLHTTIELYKLKGINTFAGVFAAIATGFIIWVIFLMFLLFLSIAAAFYFGDLLGKWHYGFFIVTGIYALAGIVIYIIRVKCLKEKINNFIIGQIFKE